MINKKYNGTVIVHCHQPSAYWEFAAVSLQIGCLLSLSRTLLLPVQGWHPVFRCEGLLPGSTSNLPVLRDAGPFWTRSRTQRRTLGYRLLPRLVLPTVLALLIVWHRLRWWHWLVKTLFICKKNHNSRYTSSIRQVIEQFLFLKERNFDGYTMQYRNCLMYIKLLRVKDNRQDK